MNTHSKYRLCVTTRILAMVAVTASLVIGGKALLSVLADSSAFPLKDAAFGFSLLILAGVFEMAVFRMSAPYRSLQEMHLFMRINKATRSSEQTAD